MQQTHIRRTAFSQLELLVVLAGAALLTGLLLPAAQTVRANAERRQSINNCKQMVLAISNIASNTTTGAIPPSFGPFPVGNTTDSSFFVSLLPYIEQNNLYTAYVSGKAAGTSPVKTYLAPSDPYNPGSNGAISYGSNANLLTVRGQPLFPNSFGGRTSGIIVVFERTAKSGATWSNDKSYLTETAAITVNGPGNTAPEVGAAAEWTHADTRATNLLPAGCIVGMGDGSARLVTPANAKAAWAWAMNPNNANAQPTGW